METNFRWAPKGQKDIQELLMKEEIDGIKMISGIHGNSEEDSIGKDKEVKKFTKHKEGHRLS